jgi:hypothetical protein
MSYRVVLLALVATLAVPAAFAADRPSAFTRDATGDVAGGLDLVRAALAVGSDGRLRAELTMSAAWTAATLRGSGSGAPASACLRIYTKRDPTSDIPDYLVCASPQTDREGYTARVMRDRRNAPPKKVAKATASRPTSRTLYVRFARTDIGDPARLRFAGEVTVPAPECSTSFGCRDSAPNGLKTVVLSLRPTSQDR